MARLTKEDIFNKKCPKIIDATWSTFGPSWGDLELLDLAIRHRARTGKYTVEEWWEYTGTLPIEVSGRIMYKGDTTEKYEKDYS